MRISFESSHISREFSARELRIVVRRDDPERGISQVNAAYFEVPPDFHTHNDSVAAALLALVNPSAARVQFNFPVSAFCAAALRRAYALEEVGPVDPALEPRTPGQMLGLCLSGGLDSMAIWVALRRMLGDEFRVITLQLGGGFAFEERGFSLFRRDVTCRTDIVQAGLYTNPWVVFVVPLLFADYLDLGSITTGHHFGETPLSVESLRDGSRPRFLAFDAALLAGGVAQVHLARVLNSIGLLHLGLLAEPEMFAACFRASAPPGKLKHYHKGLGLRILLQRVGAPEPDWLANLAPPTSPSNLAGFPGLRFTALYIIRYLGLSSIAPAYADAERFDFSFLDALSLAFMERYNTNLTQYIPASLHAPYLRVLHAAGIEPYREGDWDELEQLRAFNQALSDDRAPRRVSQADARQV